jgi:hypothetical protein
MTIIVCNKSPSVNPYVVVTTQMVKSCPLHGTIERVKCQQCEHHGRESD